MIEVHLRALETRLTEKAGAKLVDHWNNQVQFADKVKPLYPAAYVDFGTVAWTNGMAGIKTGRASITIHCVNNNSRETNHQAEDKDGKRLKRFDWSKAVTAALDGYSAKDNCGNPVIKSMQLESSQMDTNHDALTDDMVTYSCTLYYYDTWNEKDWREVLLQAVTVEQVDTIPE